jgi:hypothetical protein
VKTTEPQPRIDLKKSASERQQRRRRLRRRRSARVRLALRAY